MGKNAEKNTKSKIVSASWELFYENGYENTTIEDIVDRSHTSKGTFYHYFESKKDLLSTLSTLFDSKYEELETTLPDDMGAFEKMLYLNHELFMMIENSIPMELITSLYSSQLSIKGDKNLLNRERTYFKLLRKIAIEGKKNGEFCDDISVNEIIKAYAMFERALITDWCLCNGEYSLYKYSDSLLPRFFKGFLK